MSDPLLPQRKAVPKIEWHPELCNCVGGHNPEREEHTPSCVAYKTWLRSIALQRRVKEYNRSLSGGLQRGPGQ